ncbi:uncharacterized protein BYT42DRAFT_565645 [Radiomyces spectabilis]|uniref:uncharacterized protein n=1 Tax=Radiomyces spectabilis TaxID=64574 RepID=UPI0022206AAF|nr:uncharacterized protein BYT42DRAFT_565645 [Radiomyces spectabilis]KAI8381197.1 hypothetical protein BYT42DRAFT_565645 [Radiomyces spectabilis]
MNPFQDKDYIQKPDTIDILVCEKPNLHHVFEDAPRSPTIDITPCYFNPTELLSQPPSPTTMLSDTLTTFLTPCSSAKSTKHVLLSRLAQSTVGSNIHTEFRKYALGKPHLQDGYKNDTFASCKKPSHSYAARFQDGLRRIFSQCSTDKITEARWHAYQKQIMVGCCNKIPYEHKSQQQPRLHRLFVFDQTGVREHRLRWRRPSLLSHDRICEVATEGSEWKTVLENDDQAMDGLIRIGTLAIHNESDSDSGQPQVLQADLLLPHYTLLHLMKDVAERAISITNNEDSNQY